MLMQQGRTDEGCDLWKGAVTAHDSWESKVMGDFPTLLNNFVKCSKNRRATKDLEWVKKRYPGL